MIANTRGYSKGGIAEPSHGTWKMSGEAHKRMVMLIQHSIGELTDGKYKPVVDGDYGSATDAAVRGLQQMMSLPVNGIISHDEMSMILSLYDDLDMRSMPGVKWSYDHLNYNVKQFTEETTVKKMVVLHHTVSGGNPFNVSQHFDDKGYATHYCIGSDGTILQTAPLAWWAYHINMRADNKHISKSHEMYMAQSSIGIEICCWGALKEDRNGKPYREYKDSKTGHVVRVDMDEEMCIRYDTKWNGSHWFERYTPEQIEAVKVLLKALRDGGYFIPDKRDYMDWTWLRTDTAAIEGKRGLVSHTSLRKEGSKSDIHPQPEMLQMLQDTFGR